MACEADAALARSKLPVHPCTFCYASFYCAGPHANDKYCKCSFQEVTRLNDAPRGILSFWCSEDCMIRDHNDWPDDDRSMDDWGHGDNVFRPMKRN